MYTVRPIKGNEHYKTIATDGLSAIMDPLYHQKQVLFVKDSYTEEWSSMLDILRHKLETYDPSVPALLAHTIKCLKKHRYRGSRTTDLFTVVVESGRADLLCVLLKKYPQYTETLFCASLRVMATLGSSRACSKDAVHRAKTVHAMLYACVDPTVAREKFLDL